MAMAKAQESKFNQVSTYCNSGCLLTSHWPAQSYDQAQSQEAGNTPFPAGGQDKAVNAGRGKEIGPIVKSIIGVSKIK